jgi:purine-nucleoside phosphorylase
MEHFKRKVEEAAAFVRERLAAQPGIGLVLGTGLGEIADAMEERTVLAYGDIPHYPVSTAPSHHGRLVSGRWAGKAVVAMQGRFHLYEGYSPLEISFPIRVLKEIGVKALILSNAVGGLDPSFEVGDLMLVSDHINLTGCNPLVGPNVDAWGPRFPDMAKPYSLRLRRLALETSRAEKIRLREGVFAGLCGPSLETAAETRFLRTIGADAVGMSLVMEAITAVHAGIELAAISVITNVNLPDDYKPAFLDEIVTVAEKAGKTLALLLERMIGGMEIGR